MSREWNEEKHRHDWIGEAWYDKVVIVLGYFWIVNFAIGFVVGFMEGLLG